MRSTQQFDVRRRRSRAHGPSLISGVDHGSVMWLVAEGDGEFSGAGGLISSNFTFSEPGVLVDNRYAGVHTQ